MDRYTKIKWTEEDINTINPRMIDNSVGVIPPKNDDTDVFMHV